MQGENLSKLLHLLTGKDTTKGVEPGKGSNRDDIEKHNIVSSVLSSEERSKIVDISTIFGNTIEIGKFTQDSTHRHIAAIYADEVAQAFQVGKYAQREMDILEKPESSNIIGKVLGTEINKEVKSVKPETKDDSNSLNLIEAGKGLLLLTIGLAGLGIAIKTWSDIPGMDIVKVLGSVGVLIAGILFIGKNENTKKGIISFGVILLEIFALSYVINALGESIKNWSTIRTEDILKVGAIFGGLVALIGIMGSPIVKKVMVTGEAVFAGLLVIATGLGFVLPILSSGIKSVKDIESNDLLKVGAIFGGLGLLIGIMGAGPIAMALGIGEAVFAGLLFIATGIGLVLPILSSGIKSVKDIESNDLLKVVSIFGGLGLLIGIMGTPPISLAMGIGEAVFAGLLFIATGIGLVLPILSSGIKSVRDIEYDELLKVVAIFGGLGLLIGIMGTPPISLVVGIGGAVFTGLLFIATGIGSVLPILSSGIKSVRDIEYDELLKVVAIFGGLGLLVGVMGTPPISLVVGIGGAVFAGLLLLVKGVAEVIPKIVDSVKYISNLNEGDVDHIFKILKRFLYGASNILNDGEEKSSWWGNLKKTFMATTTAVTSIPLLASLGALISQVTDLIPPLSFLMQEGKKMSKDEGGINNVFESIKQFFEGSQIFGLKSFLFSKISLTSITPLVALSAALLPLVHNINVFAKAGEDINKASMSQTIGVIQTFTDEINNLTNINKDTPERLSKLGHAFGIIQEKIGFLASYSTNIGIVTESVEKLLQNTEGFNVYSTNIGIVTESVEKLLQNTEGLKVLDETFKGIFQSIERLDASKIQTITIQADIVQIHKTNDILLTQVDIQKKILQEIINNGKEIAAMGSMSSPNVSVTNTGSSKDKISSVSTQTPRQLFNSSAYSFG